MDLLTIQHEDFTMYVDCTKFDDIWNKAKSNVGEKDLLSTYTWSEGVVSVERNGEPMQKEKRLLPCSLTMRNTRFGWISRNT